MLGAGCWGLDAQYLPPSTLAAGAYDDDLTDLTSILERALKRAWGAKHVAPDVELISAEGAAMMRKAEEGFGRKFNDVGYRDPHFFVLANLQYNSYLHAAFKNYSFSHQLQGLLKDDKGKIRSYQEFGTAAGLIVDNYYNWWLRAEYETAVGTGEMAAKWQQFQKTKKALPFLKYSSVDNAGACEMHRALDGIVKHIDDPFWDVHFPLNGWRCRCKVIQRMVPQADSGMRTSEEQHPPSFRHNAGKTGRYWKEGMEPYRPQCLDTQLLNCDAGKYTNAAAKAEWEAYDKRKWTKRRADLHPDVQQYACEAEWIFPSDGYLLVSEGHELQPVKLQDSEELNIGIRLAKERGERVRLEDERGLDTHYDSTRNGVAWEFKNSKTGSSGSVFSHLRRSLKASKVRTIIQIPQAMRGVAQAEADIINYIKRKREQNTLSDLDKIIVEYFTPDGKLHLRILNLITGVWK